MKTTLIFLHGGPGFRDYLGPFFEELNKEFECIFYDQIQGPEISIEHLLGQLDQMVVEAKFKVILVGHSWGAVLATEYAKRNPAKIAGLVLISAGMNHLQWKEEYHKELEDRGLNDAKPEEIFLTAEEVGIGKSFLESIERDFSDETFDSIFKNYLQTYDLLSALPTLQIPLINIFGEKDIRFPKRVTQSFKEFKNDIINYEIPNTGHFPFLQQSGRAQIFEIIKKHFK